MSLAYLCWADACASLTVFCERCWGAVVDSHKLNKSNNDETDFGISSGVPYEKIVSCNLLSSPRLWPLGLRGQSPDW